MARQLLRAFATAIREQRPHHRSKSPRHPTRRRVAAPRHRACLDVRRYSPMEL